jgi:multidrug efflux pump subunit AcrA (membrane-fusion protein)
MTPTRRLQLAAVAALLLAGSIVAFRAGAFGAAARLLSKGHGEGPGEEDVPVVPVSRGAFRHEVIAEGNLKATKATPLITPGEDASFLIAWMAEDGSRVAKGDLVVGFDPTRIDKELALGLSDRQSADGRLVKERVEAGALLANLDRDLSLSTREVESARTFESLDPALFSRNEVLESRLDLDLAVRREDRNRKTRTGRGRLAKADEALIVVDRTKADLKVDKARRERGSLEVRAPHDGVVVLSRDFRGELFQPGQAVYSGQTLGQLPDLAEMEAEVWVLESDAGGLAEGRSAVVTLDSQPGVEYPATVKRVDTVPKPRIRGVPVQYFGAVLQLSRTDPKTMKLGQRIRARLLLADEKDVLSVPRQAVAERNGKRVVFRRDPKKGRLAPVEVKLGATSLSRVVIAEGLAPGDAIAARDPRAPGTQVAGAAAAGPSPAAVSGPPR